MLVLTLPDVTTDDHLLPRLQKGDRQAVMMVYERYFAPLYQYARLKTGDLVVAEDIVSDVFVTLIESIGTSNAPRTHLRGWLFQVARNHMSRVRSTPRTIDVSELEEWMPTPTETNPETQMLERFDLQRVRHALRMLTNDHQEVLILRFGQRLSLQETADVMGKSLSAIKSLQFRAVETLRTILVGGEA